MSTELEHRLQRALGAYADLADPADEAGTAADPEETDARVVVPLAGGAEHRRARWWPAAALAGAAAAAAVGGTLVLGGGPDPAPAAPAATAASGPVPTGAAASGGPAATGTSIPYTLFTHCGIRLARIGDTWFRADDPPGGDSRSAPEGWGDPYQAGTMTLTGPTTALFRDDAGHEVTFTAGYGPDDPGMLCD